MVLGFNQRADNVGIGTTAPKQTLTVNDTNNINLSFPDGLFGISPISQEIPVAGSYTVPVGKNLFITNIYHPNPGSESIKIDSVPVVETTIAASQARTLGMPIIAGAGHVVTSSSNTVSFNEYLLDQ